MSKLCQCIAILLGLLQGTQSQGPRRRHPKKLWIHHQDSSCSNFNAPRHNHTHCDCLCYYVAVEDGRHTGSLSVCYHSGLCPQGFHTRCIRFKIRTQLFKQHPAKDVTDWDFADDIPLSCVTMADAQSLLTAVERNVSDVGLYINLK